MKERITIETLDALKPIAFELANEATKNLKDCHYVDIRMEASQQREATVLNGNPVGARQDWETSFGVRVIAGDKMKAPGHFGLHFGPREAKNFASVAREGIRHAYERALANAAFKLSMKRELGSLGESFYSTTLAPVEIHQSQTQLPSQIDPRTVPVAKLVKEALDISKDIQKVENIIANEVLLETLIVRKLFLSSEGANIDFTFPLTQLLTFVVTKPAGWQRSSYYDCIGDLAGWEVIEGENIYGQTGHQFSLNIAHQASKLSQAPVLPSSEKEVVVVTDPHYNALVVHEIIGHPVELDRILKWETGYAGRSRFLKSFENNQIGKKVASPLVTAFSDPELRGYGYVTFDDEGVKSKKVVHINKGILTPDFLNSRETAAIMQTMGIPVEPNGAVRAMDPVYVSLIRMTNTCFAPGDRNPEEIIKEIDEGYYFKRSRIPSISESRENFRISAWETWKIEKGELTTLYRDGSISSDSEKYLKSIDAVGNDFKLFPIFNCGKGQPMQAMRVGNGGPTMRGRAKVVGGYLKGGSTV